MILKSPTERKRSLFGTRSFPVRALLLAIVVFLGGVSLAIAQQRVQKKYPAGKNVRLELRNISGEVVVESWDRDEIKVSATLESPAALFSPRQIRDGLIIDVTGDNRGRDNVGSINFKVQVPASSSVDLETKNGDIHVSNVHGGSVRAHVSLDGDIILSGVNASQVNASNGTGNIFFDGEFARGGTYEFQSMSGDITIRIPYNSAFHLVAAIPTRKIELGVFWNNRFQRLGDGRKYVGDVGDGRSSVSVTNFRGSISFMRR